MSLSKLGRIVNAFAGKNDPEDGRELVQELMLMTLARATRADANIQGVEVEQVKNILKQTLGVDVSSGDIRVAAMSDIYETASFKKYLARVGAQVDLKARQTIVRALAQVVSADGHIRPQEVEFFNMVAQALKLDPSDLATLT